MDRKALDWTFEKYLIDWRRKRTGELPWTNYTPYEIRIIGALVRLGRREAALELLRFFMTDRRPLAWNQWPEIAWRDPLAPAHIGDVPHTWIAAEFVLAVRSLFAFEDTTRQQLVLAAGIDAAWIDGDGVRLNQVTTSFGTISFTMRSQRRGKSVLVELSGDLGIPAGGIVIRPPLRQPIRGVTLNGSPSDDFAPAEVVIHSMPAQLIIHT